MWFLFYGLSILKEASLLSDGYAFQLEWFREHDVLLHFQQGLRLGDNAPRRRFRQLVLLLEYVLHGRRSVGPTAYLSRCCRFKRAMVVWQRLPTQNGLAFGERVICLAGRCESSLPTIVPPSNLLKNHSPAKTSLSKREA